MSNYYVNKSKYEKDFTILPNKMLSDENLSWRARGILCYLLHLPHDWVIHESEVMKHSSKEGRDAFKTAIKELYEFGYMKKESTRDEKGKITGWNTYVFPDSQITRNPQSGQPTNWSEQNVDNPSLLSTNVLQSTESLPITNKQKHQSKIDDIFEEWYSGYPRKEGKGYAKSKFKSKLKEGVTLDELKNGLNNYINYIKLNNIQKKYIKTPGTWLNQDCHLDEYDLTPKQGGKYGRNQTSSKPTPDEDYDNFSL